MHPYKARYIQVDTSQIRSKYRLVDSVSPTVPISEDLIFLM